MSSRLSLVEISTLNFFSNLNLLSDRTALDIRIRTFRITAFSKLVCHWNRSLSRLVEPHSIFSTHHSSIHRGSARRLRSTFYAILGVVLIAPIIAKQASLCRTLFHRWPPDQKTVRNSWPNNRSGIATSSRVALDHSYPSAPCAGFTKCR